MHRQLHRSCVISWRIVVIVTVAFVIGAVAGTLTYMSDRSVAQALLAAGTATGGTASLLNQLFPTRRMHRPNRGDDDQGEERNSDHPERSR